MEHPTENRKERTMRRRHLRIRRWLAVAAALACLIFATSASAKPMGVGGDGIVVNAQPVAAPSDGSGSFSNWWYVAIGAGAALAVALGGAGLRAAASRRRLAQPAH
jgi:hypothetical protein